MDHKINVLGVEIEAPYAPLKDFRIIPEDAYVYMVDIYSCCSVIEKRAESFMDEVIYSAGKLSLLYARRESAEIVANALRDTHFGDTE